MLKGDFVNLIDMKAGIEHFGRKIPDTMDIIIAVLDYTLESISIAKRIASFCREADIKNFWLVLNKIGSEEIKSMLINELEVLQEKVIGIVPFDEELIKTSLSRKAIGDCKALENIKNILAQLEQRVSTSSG